MIEHKNDFRNGFFKDNALKRHFLVISISAKSVHLKLPRHQTFGMPMGPYNDHRNCLFRGTDQNLAIH